MKFKSFLLGSTCLAVGYIAAGLSAEAKEKEYVEKIQKLKEDHKGTYMSLNLANQRIDKITKENEDLRNKNNFLSRSLCDTDERVLELSATNVQEKAKAAALENEVQQLKEEKEKLNFIIEQCDANGEVLNTYKSFEEASKKSGVPETGIKKCVMCVQKTAGKFVWKVNFLNNGKAGK